MPFLRNPDQHPRLYARDLALIQRIVGGVVAFLKMALMVAFFAVALYCLFLMAFAL